MGPDNIPNKLLEDFALELAPVIQNIYNQTLEEGHIPALLKSSIVTPIPKVTPPREIESDLRPISLTCTLAEVMEGFAWNGLLPKVDGKIDMRQYARKGHSTTDALLYMLQAVYEATDSGEPGARIFCADFSKGFDLIDHNILMTELQQLDVDEALFCWIRQAVRIGGNMSDWRTLNGGVPQGTKLGVILFSVMTNRLLSDWKLHIKFVDDTSAIEILPRNSISLLNSAATNIHQFPIDHKMRLNPPKCKEMLINFMRYSNFSLRPIIIGNKVIERVSTYKILGVHVDCDLKWNTHVEYICKKASKRLYSLRVLKRAGVDEMSILKVYLTTIRPVLEYAIPVRQAIPDYLSDKIESLQKWVLHIVFPYIDSYNSALLAAGLETLEHRRSWLCDKYMKRITTKTSHPLNTLLPRISKTCQYSLRAEKRDIHFFRDRRNCSLTEKNRGIFMLKYFS